MTIQQFRNKILGKKGLSIIINSLQEQNTMLLFNKMLGINFGTGSDDVTASASQYPKCLLWFHSESGAIECNYYIGSLPYYPSITIKELPLNASVKYLL